MERPYKENESMYFALIEISLRFDGYYKYPNIFSDIVVTAFASVNIHCVSSQHQLNQVVGGL